LSRDAHCRRRLLGRFSAQEVTMARSRSGIGRRSTKSSRRPAPKAKTEDENGGASAPRNPGIRFIDDMPWGAHACVFYESKQDLLDTAVPYFDAGLRSNEFCLWAVSDPITQADAKRALRRAVPDLDRRLAAGQIELLSGREWYLQEDRFKLERVLDGWSSKLEGALANGYDGMRVSGNALWLGTSHWKAFCEYEQEIDRVFADQKMIALCTYRLEASSAVDILDVARAHQFSIARRNGDWEFLETPELKRSKQEIKRLSDALEVLSRPFPRHRSLTPRERLTLAQIVRGASSKEAARTLGVSPRTVEFHRTNIMRKLGARNTVDLVRRVLGQ
jgi:DNA-binding CsgD family transcriptional regulator